MKNVARIVHVDDVKGERCVACAAPAETAVDLDTPAGVPMPRARLVTTARVCRACAEAQAAALRPDGRLGVALAAGPPVLAAAAGLVVGRRDGIATTVALVSVLALVLGLRAARNRARARRTPVLLLEAEGDRLVLQLAVPATASASPSPGEYRSAPAHAPEGDEPVAPLPPRRKLGIAWPIGLLVSSAVLVLGWSGAFERSSIVFVDSPKHAVRVTLDDDAFELPAGGRTSRKVRAGTHAFEVDYLDTGERVRGELESRATRGVLLSTEPTQCYSVWVVSKDPVRHDHGPVYWIDVDVPERTFERAACGDDAEAP